MLGGVLIGLVLLITKFFGPKWGGIIAMVPLSFTLSYVLATYGNNAAFQLSFLKGGIAGWVSFGIFVLILILLMPSSLGFWTKLALAYAAWFCVAFFLSVLG